MTSDTFASKYYGDVYAGVSTPKGKSQPLPAGEAGIYPGYAVRISSNTWVLAKNSDKSVAGIAANASSHDLDTAYTVTTDIFEIYRCGLGDEVYAYYGAQSPAVNLVQGDVMVLSATDGLLAKFAYTNATDYTDTLMNRVGIVQDLAITGSTSDNKLVKIALSI